MHLATVVRDGHPCPVVLDGGRALPARALVPDGDLVDLIASHPPAELRRLAADADGWFDLDPSTAQYAVPYRSASKVMGIGLNYRAHADDLSAPRPDEPVFFLKADHTLIGPGQSVPLPPQSTRVTCEAELGLVIGRTCHRVDVDDALDHVWGAVPVLDQTAEDILERNPRFLTRAKNFPGFFSFGPGIVPLDEVVDEVGSLDHLRVTTVHNGEVHRAATVADALFSPAEIVSFLSHVMPLNPGDIVSTGTPGAVHVVGGDVAECRLDGVGTLTNPVHQEDAA